MNKCEAVRFFDLLNTITYGSETLAMLEGFNHLGVLKSFLAKMIQMHFQISPLTGYPWYTRGGRIILKGFYVIRIIFLKLFCFGAGFPY